MTLRFDRSIPLPSAIALLGAAVALGALVLPWFALTPAAAKAMVDLFGSMFTDPSDPASLSVPKELLAQQVTQAASKDLVGFRAFAPLSVGLYVLGAIAAIWAAIQLWANAAGVGQRRGELIGAAAVLATRPVLALLRDPTLGKSPVSGMPIDLVSPSTGLYVAFAGAALVAVAALLVREASAAADPAWSAAQAAPAAAYTQPAAPAYAAPAYTTAVPGQPGATLYTSGGAYGEEGPSTLDRDARLVRPNDPYAPPPLATPAVPIMPTPAQVMPIHDHAPVNDQPGSIYGVPRPETAPQQPPQRQGSTAPPGFA